MARTSGDSVGSFSHAGGIIATTAVTRSRSSSRTRFCSVWSSRQLSDWPYGRMISRLKARAMALSESRFFLSVLSSPLCAINRNGCAMVAFGAVLVEKRVWKNIECTSIDGSDRSLK